MCLKYKKRVYMTCRILLTHIFFCNTMNYHIKWCNIANRQQKVVLSNIMSFRNLQLFDIIWKRKFYILMRF